MLHHPFETVKGNYIFLVYAEDFSGEAAEQMRIIFTFFLYSEIFKEDSVCLIIIVKNIS